MERQLLHPVALGDINDVEAYVGAIMATLRLDDQDEQEELIAEGLELVVCRHASLGPGESLQQALAGWLRHRLQDRWRERHPEWRRNTRGATAYLLPAPTGLAWEHQPETCSFDPAGPDERGLAHSRLALEIFENEDDLGDPRKVGRSQGVPSLKAIPTGTRHGLWTLITDERNTPTNPAPAELAPAQPPTFKL